MVRANLPDWSLRGVLALLVAALGLAACAGSTTDRDVGYVDAARVKLWHDEAKKAGNEEKLILIDPRPSEAYAAEHIDGALNLTIADAQMPGSSVFAGAPGGLKSPVKLSKYKRIVVYGEDASSALPLAMAKRLLRLGYEDTVVLSGGLRAWKAASGPTTKP